MNFIEIIQATFTPGESKTWMLGGSYFELIDCPNTIDVVLTDRNGAQRGIMKAAEASFHLRNTEFDTIQLTSATAQTVRFGYGSGEAGTRRASGSVNIANKRGAFTQAQGPNITNGASVQLLAANAARSYLLIQNNDASGDIYVTLDGTAATTAKGIKIAAGGSLELADFLPTGQVNAIGNTAGNANTVLVEG